MSYNPEFQINPQQLEMIEDALRAEIGRLTKPDTDMKPKKWNEITPEFEDAKKLRELLGHLHNQKRWFKPEEVVPLG